jgi:hypothetical protein
LKSLKKAAKSVKKAASDLHEAVSGMAEWAEDEQFIYPEDAQSCGMDIGAMSALTMVLDRIEQEVSEMNIVWEERENSGGNKAW